MKRIIFAVSIISLLLLSACGVAAATPAPASVQDEAYAAPQRLPSFNSSPLHQSAAGGDTANAPATVDQNGNPVTQDRLVIQNADLTIVVKDPAGKMQAISAMANTMGGFVVSSNVDQTIAPDGTKIPQGSIAVRVPAAKLDEALKEIKADAVDVQTESRTGQDVTKEYTDLQSQLTNLQDTEQQLTLIMQKTDKVDDVLTVFNQLTQIRGQIDVIKGQIQYYAQSAALSAITVRLVAEQSVQPIQIAGWKPQGDARDAVQTLVNFFQGFVTFLIWLVLFVLPAGVLVLLPFFLLFLLIRALVRWMRRRREKKAVVGEK